jgi:hypothetical protein
MISTTDSVLSHDILSGQTSLSNKNATQTAARAKTQKLAAETKAGNAEEAQLQHVKCTLPHELSEYDFYFDRTLVSMGNRSRTC